MTAKNHDHYSREDLAPAILPVFDRVVALLQARRSVLMIGPPGVGKTMIARRVGSYLDGDPAEISEGASVRKLAGLDRDGVYSRDVPFRAPHHTCSVAGLLGGGRPTRPGEVSLAHGGLLFLDEIPEFSVAALSGVRHAYRDGFVDFHRPAGRWTFPARFRLLGAMNPCPCGWLGTPQRACTCSLALAKRYHDRIPAGMFDEQIEIPFWNTAQAAAGAGQ